MGFFIFPAIIIGIVHGWRADNVESPLFLVWWGSSIFAFFAVTGNHGWYIMPVIVPCAILIGYSVSLVSESDFAAVLIGIGAVAMLTINGFSVSTGAIVFVFLVIFLEDPLVNFIDNFQSKDSIKIRLRVVPIIILMVVAFSLVGIPGLIDDSKRYDGHEQLGITVSEKTGKDEIVALGPNTSTGGLFVFSFHAQRPLDSATLTRLNETSDIQYAVVVNRSRSKLGREHKVIGSVNDLRAIEFNDTL
jgi:hypothetical protein